MAVRRVAGCKNPEAGIVENGNAGPLEKYFERDEGLKMDCRLSDYNFEFPKELIASRTAGKGKTHILYCPKNGGERRIMKAPEIVDLFRPGDCLVVNNTKVIPARLYGETQFGGQVEVLLVPFLQTLNRQDRFYNLHQDSSLELK